MKKSLTIIALLAGAATVYSQGAVDFGDYTPGASTGFNIHIYSPNPANPGVEQTGNSTLLYNGVNTGDAPAGTMAAYGGVAIGGTGTGSPTNQGTAPGTAAAGYANGDNFTVELYAASGDVVSSGFSALTGVTETASTAGGNIPYLADASGGAGAAGEFQGGVSISFNGTAAVGGLTLATGSTATFALAAWYNEGGTITTLAAAEAAGVPYGWSPLGAESIGGVGGGAPKNLPGLGDSYTTDGGITSFSLITATPEPSTIALGVIGASAFLMRLRRKN